MVCPICVTTAVLANAPYLAAGLAATALAAQGKKPLKAPERIAFKPEKPFKLSKGSSEPPKRLPHAE
jgi:hypothetical protein